MNFWVSTRCVLSVQILATPSHNLVVGQTGIWARPGRAVRSVAGRCRFFFSRAHLYFISYRISVLSPLCPLSIKLDRSAYCKLVELKNVVSDYQRTSCVFHSFTQFLLNAWCRCQANSETDRQKSALFAVEARRADCRRRPLVPTSQYQQLYVQQQEHLCQHECPPYPTASDHTQVVALARSLQSASH